MKKKILCFDLDGVICKTAKKTTLNLNLSKIILTKL